MGHPTLQLLKMKKFRIHSSAKKSIIPNPCLGVVILGREFQDFDARSKLSTKFMVFSPSLPPTTTNFLSRSATPNWSLCPERFAT
jgi:hypothetical protein